MGNFKHHNINEHPCNCLCSTCSKGYSAQGQLQNHINVIHLGMSHKCPVSECKVHFMSKKGLDNHLLSLHNSKSDVYVCNFCSLDFESLAKLKYHKISHSTTKKHECTWCRSKFGRNLDRTRHQNSSCKNRHEHKPQQSEVSECDSTSSKKSNGKKKQLRSQRPLSRRRLIRHQYFYLSHVQYAMNASQIEKMQVSICARCTKEHQYTLALTVALLFVPEKCYMITKQVSIVNKLSNNNS